MDNRRRSRTVLCTTAWTALFAALLCAPACKLVGGVVEAPGAIVGAATGKEEKPPPIDLERAKQEVRTLADHILLQVDVGAYLFAEQEGTEVGARQSLIFRIQAAERAMAAATEPRPLTGLANLLALAAYEARLHEIYWSAKFGAAGQPMVEAWRRIETEGLVAAEACLPADQVAAMREALKQWRAASDDPASMLGAGAPRFSDLLDEQTEAGKKSTLFGNLGLDPLEGLEPAAREVARARDLAERALFLVQRSGRVIAWRTELLTLQLTAQPDIQSVLADLERTSKSIEQVAATAQGLPEQLRVEGDALLQRVSAEIAAQRAGIVADVEKVSGPTQTLLAQSEETLDAATRTMQALDVTTKTVDEFVGQFTEPDPEGAEPAPPAADEPPGKPFDPVEYTALATQVGIALEQLNTTVARVDQTLPALQKNVDDAAARIDRSIERAYELALRLVLIAIGAAAVAVVVVRLIARRRETGRSGPAA